MEGIEPQRFAQLRQALDTQRARIAAACSAAGRPSNSVRLLPITKYFPAVDAAALVELGCRDLGENRDQEAAAKAAEVPALTRVAVRWHMVGQLQRKKVNSVARWAHSVQSVDRRELVAALARASTAALDDGHRDGPLDVLLQLSVDGNEARGGVTQDRLAELGEAVQEAGSLELRGLMAVAPLGWEPEAAFARVAASAVQFRAQFPFADELSLGMSGDLEIAIQYGSTCVRVGTAVMGPRPLISP